MEFCFGSILSRNNTLGWLFSVSPRSWKLFFYWKNRAFGRFNCPNPSKAKEHTPLPPRFGMQKLSGTAPRKASHREHLGLRFINKLKSAMNDPSTHAGNASQEYSALPPPLHPFLLSKIKRRQNLRTLRLLFNRKFRFWIIFRATSILRQTCCLQKHHLVRIA